MPITIDRSNDADRPAILKLLTEARGDDLTETQRAQRGFVQGAMDAAMLAQFQTGLGVYVARDQSQLAALCMNATADLVGGGPPNAMAQALSTAQLDTPLAHIFFYGPVAVSRRYQGQGLLTRLLVHACQQRRAAYRLGALFVELANHKSLAIHRHYGMTETATFEFKNRPYTIFTFAPDAIINRYN